MSYSFEFDVTQLSKELDKVASPESLRRATEKSCMKVQAKAVQNLKRDSRWHTGALAASIGSEIQGYGTDIKGIVGSPLEYAPYVEYGTGIYASNGQGRQTPWLFPNPDGYYTYVNDKGEEVAPEYMLTEGQEPTFFLSKALDECIPSIELIFREELMKNV